MHMSDALLSPAVGGAMWAATAAATIHCSRKVSRDMDDRKVPLMGVLGAFIFAAQMINFTIPGTGSSGHLGGGLILAILLGPYPAFLVMASVLTVQALFFADGGLLALGANIFNLGFFSCFLAYPFLYRPLAGQNPTRARITFASVVAAVGALQLGSFGVVLQTVLSGMAEIRLTSFLLLMQPIHLAIGIVEGLVTASVVAFVWKAQPGMVEIAPAASGGSGVSYRKIAAVFGVLALLTGGGLSWLASSQPDGLEWSIARLTGSEGSAAPPEVAGGKLKSLQEKTAILPDYDFKGTGGEDTGPGTPVSGIVGGILTLLMTLGAGWMLKRRKS